MGNGLGNGLGQGGRPRYERPAAARPAVPEPKVAEWEASQPRETQPREAQPRESQPRETQPREAQARESQAREPLPQENPAARARAARARGSGCRRAAVPSAPRPARPGSRPGLQGGGHAAPSGESPRLDARLRPRGTGGQPRSPGRAGVPGRPGFPGAPADAAAVRRNLRDGGSGGCRSGGCRADPVGAPSSARHGSAGGRGRADGAPGPEGSARPAVLGAVLGRDHVRQLAPAGLARLFWRLTALLRPAERTGSGVSCVRAHGSGFMASSARSEIDLLELGGRVRPAPEAGPVARYPARSASALADRPCSGPTPPDHSTRRITLRFLVVRF